MEQMIDSKKTKLEMTAIISIAAKNTKSKYSYYQVYGSILKELTMPRSIIMQLGNTVFIMHRTEQDPTVAVMRALNADTAQNFLDSCEKFAQLAYNEYKIDTIVSFYEDKTLNNVFAYVGRNQPANMGYQIATLEDGSFRATARLGPDIQAQ